MEGEVYTYGGRSSVARKWKTAIIIWVGIFVYFGIGFFHPRDADLLLIIFDSLLLLVATVYTVAIWVRDRAKGEPEKAYHLSVYPRAWLRFMFDEGEPQQQKRTERKPRH